METRPDGSGLAVCRPDHFRHDQSEGGQIDQLADICQLMEIAMERIKSLEKGRLAWYMNKTSREMLRLQLKDNAKYQLTRETVAGRQVTSYAESRSARAKRSPTPKPKSKPHKERKHADQQIYPHSVKTCL